MGILGWSTWWGALIKIFTNASFEIERGQCPPFLSSRCVFERYIYFGWVLCANECIDSRMRSRKMGLYVKLIWRRHMTI